MQGHFVGKDKENSVVLLQTWNLNKQYKGKVKIQLE